MSVHKDKRTGKWYVSCRYDNWDGARIWSIKGRLDSVINYVTNPEKTDGSIYTDMELQALTDVIDYAEDG